MGGKLFRHRPRRRRQRADQLRFHRSRNRLSAHRRQLQSGDHDRRARRSVRAAAGVRARFEDADRDRSRPVRREGAPLRDAGDDAAEIRAARSRVAARDVVHSLHLGHHRPRQGRAAHGARHVVDRRRLLGADHRPVRARHGALAAAAVSFLCAEFVGARHPRHRRQRLHHGAVLDQRSGAAAQERRIHLLPRRADHVSLSAAGDARRDGPALSQSAALRFRRRHHAGDAQPRVRKSSGRAIARRLRHHRNLDHGDDELAERPARARLLRLSGAGACGAHRRCQRPRRRSRTRKAS